MDIQGLERYSREEIEEQLQRGAVFVMYQYCISIIFVTFKRPSAIYFIPVGGSRFIKGLPFTALSLVFGWWGFPWGPIYTIGSLARNSAGGLDVTDSVVTSYGFNRR